MHTTLPFLPTTYVERRKVLMEAIGSGQVLLIANDENSINFKDNVHQYRQDSCFLYYVGISLPHIAMLIDVDEGHVTLYGDDATIDAIIWTGDLPTLASLGELSGIERVKPYHQMKKDLKSNVHYLPPYRASQTYTLQRLMDIDDIQPSVALIKAIVSQRSIKTEEEITEIEKAVALSIKMHNYVMERARPGMYEYQLVAEASKFAFEHDCRWSFTPILTTHGETLHNHYYGNKISHEDMILFDGGIELASGYCGDITRTFSSNGKFSSLQQDMYEIVRSAYDAAIDFSKPGVAFREVHLEACRSLMRGLKDLGWVHGDIDEGVAAGAHTMFFQCGLGHMMGLDVHDMENLGEAYVGYTDEMTKSKDFGLKSLRLGRSLEPGFVITIEPGIYIIPQLIDKYQAEGKYTEFLNYNVINQHRDFGGIRIEDDFVVCDMGLKKLGVNPHCAL